MWCTLPQKGCLLAWGYPMDYQNVPQWMSFLLVCLLGAQLMDESWVLQNLDWFCTINRNSSLCPSLDSAWHYSVNIAWKYYTMLGGMRKLGSHLDRNLAELPKYHFPWSISLSKARQSPMDFGRIGFEFWFFVQSQSKFCSFHHIWTWLKSYITFTAVFSMKWSLQMYSQRSEDLSMWPQLYVL